MSQDRRHAAIMFTDIVGYTKLMGEDEDRAFEVLKKNQEIHNELIEQFNGTLIKEMGDGMLVSFDLASDAVRCAIEIQNTSKEQGIPLKIGIHQGEVVFADADVLGDGVNIASRLQENAEAGSINLSGRVNSDVKNKAGISTRFVEEKTFKNVDEPIKVYQVVGDDEQPATVVEKKRKIGNKYLYYMLGGVIIVLAVLFIRNYLPQSSSPSGIDPPITIAVLAFDDQSPDGDQEWLGDGMADEILNVLAKVNGLQVTGKTSSFSFKGKDDTITEIGEALGVKTVLEGSVSKIGNKLRITAQLIDVESDKHIWSDKYDRDATDIFSIIDEVAQNISSSLMRELSIEEVKNIKMAYQPKAEAYEYFIKAEQMHMNDFLKAKELYQKAVSIDPYYMDALAGLANIYDTMGNFLDNTIVDHLKRDSILNVAYQTDPDAPYVLYLKGYISNNYDSVFYFLHKAFEIDPSNKGTTLLVNKMQIIGFNDLCISLCRKFLAADPLNKSLRGFLIASLWSSGNIDDLRKQVRQSLDFDRDDFTANGALLDIAIAFDQDTTEAKRILNKLIESITFRPLNKLLIAKLLAIEGKKEEALEVEASVSDFNFKWKWIFDLRLHLMLDMKSEALTVMDEVLNSLDNPYSSDFLGYLSLLGDPYYDKIRDEPQFQEWLEEARIVHEERVRKYYHLFDE